jgi:hypothetical protein
VNTVLNDFAEPVGSRCDYRQSACQRLQTGIGKWIVNRWQNENVRSRVKTHNVCNFAEKLHRLLTPKAQARGLVDSFVSTTGNEQTHFSILAERHRLDCKK